MFVCWPHSSPGNVSVPCPSFLPWISDGNFLLSETNNIGAHKFLKTVLCIHHSLIARMHQKAYESQDREFYSAVKCQNQNI